MREISAGIIAYRTTAEGPRFLILYHGHGNWNFPKGKIANEEKSFQTAVREMREETGLTRNDLRFNENFKTSENFTFWRNKEKIYKTIVLYLAETTSQRIRLPEKREDEEGERHEGYGWFTYKEALKILTKEDSQRVLKQAYAFLRNIELRKRGELRPRRQQAGYRPKRIEGVRPERAEGTRPERAEGTRPERAEGQQRPAMGTNKEEHPQVRRDAPEDRRRVNEAPRPSVEKPFDQRRNGVPQRPAQQRQQGRSFPQRQGQQDRPRQAGYRQRPERTGEPQPQNKNNA